MTYRSDFAGARKKYEELGQFDYDGETYVDDIGEKIGELSGSKYIYKGQFKEKSKIADGVGICVWDSGDTFKCLLI